MRCSHCGGGWSARTDGAVCGGQLKLRLKTLVDKKKVVQTRSWKSSKLSTMYITLREGFQQFDHDLSKLQQFVEVNATAFSKILKKVGSNPRTVEACRMLTLSVG